MPDDPEWDRRVRDGTVTHAELREALAPIYEYHRRIKPALDLYEKMVPLGVEKLLPAMLEDAQTRLVLSKLSNINWRRWGRASLVAGIVYVAVTVVGSTIAIMRTVGIIP